MDQTGDEDDANTSDDPLPIGVQQVSHFPMLAGIRGETSFSVHCSLFTV